MSEFASCIQSHAFAIMVGRASSSQPRFVESADANGGWQDEKGPLEI